MIREKVRKFVGDVLEKLGIDGQQFLLEHPADLGHGDYSTNAALVYARQLRRLSRELAEQIIYELKKAMPSEIAGIEIAGPGFINFRLSKVFLAASLAEVLNGAENYGRSQRLKGRRVIVEYTDPNPFKEFHLGHLMSNVIGESISRLIEWEGAEVKRVSYHGDVGIHIACAIWGILQSEGSWQEVSKKSLSERMKFLGECYSRGAAEYESSDDVKREIQEINAKIFGQSDPKINVYYENGKVWSLKYFGELYERLGSKFDFTFFESETGKIGKQLVEETLERGIFTRSEGTVVFLGEKYGLHTRVFLNAQGLPTYEAKELGLAKAKYDVYPYDISLIVTGSEVNDYFRVILKVLGLVLPELARKTIHISHGMLRLPTGKMSSRRGNIITVSSLLDALEALVHERLAERELPHFEKGKIAAAVAVGAVKFSILRQTIGSDILYDFEKSISLEGDSGSYLQYTYTRAHSVLRRAHSVGLKASAELPLRWESTHLERLLYRFPEVVERASASYEPHHVVLFLLELSGAFNTFYESHRIIGDDPGAPYRVAITQSFARVFESGLSLLGIETLERM